LFHPTILTGGTFTGTSEKPSNRSEPSLSLYCLSQGMRQVFCSTFLLDYFRWL
jgi:hypothetical protein